MISSSKFFDVLVHVRAPFSRSWGIMFVFVSIVEYVVELRIPVLLGYPVCQLIGRYCFKTPQQNYC